MLLKLLNTFIILLDKSCSCRRQSVLSSDLLEGTDQLTESLGGSWNHIFCYIAWKHADRRNAQTSVQFSSVQLLSRDQLFVTPWTTAHQASLPITSSQSLLRLVSIESLMPSNHLILCCPLLLLPSVFPSIRVFSNESVLHIRWPKYWLEFQLRHQSFQWIFRTDLL